MNKDKILLDAINNFDKNKIDNIVKCNTEIYDFMLAESQKMSPEALLFLRDNYNVSFKYIFSRIDVTVEQMKMLLQQGYKPSEKIIYTYAGYLDLSLYKMLFDYGIKIPEETVWKLDSTVFSNALIYYLENGGNPNIRPFMIHSEKIGKYQPSLIDKWIMQQNDIERSPRDVAIIDFTVNTLIKYGAKKSPYAMTKKERIEYFKLQSEDPQQFKLKQTQKIAEIQKLMDNSKDEIERIEYDMAIEKFKFDIAMCN